MADPDLDSQIGYTGKMGMGVPSTLRALLGGNVSAVQMLLGLASAAYQAASAFATATQGLLAASALQPVVAGAGIGAGGFAKRAVIAGGAAGSHAVTGIKTGDELDEVIYFVGAGTAVTNVSDLTAEFTISGSGTIDNSGHTDTTGGVLLVRWTKLTT